MSQTQTTLDTNPLTSESSHKTKIKAKATTKKDPSDGIDLDDLMNGQVDDFDAKKEYLDAKEMMDFELRIDFLLRKAQKEARDKQARNPNVKVTPDTIYMEVDREFLSGLNGGEFPSTKYVIWRNVRVCLQGASSEIAHEEGKTIHEVVFKNEGKYKLVTVLKK